MESEIKYDNSNKKFVLPKRNIILGKSDMTKHDVICYAGKLLVESGHVTKEYINSMLNREKLQRTYIGKGLAVPHGMDDSQKYIISTGACVIQFPDGIIYDEKHKVHLVVGIACKWEDNLDLLVQLANLSTDDKKLNCLFTTTNTKYIYNALIKNDK